MKDSYVEIMYIRKKSSFNRTILSTFSFPEYCFVHYCLVLLHKTLSSAWTSPLFLVSFYSILYLLDVNQICICTSCSCSFTFIMKFYYKCICILYESSLYYLYSSYCFEKLHAHYCSFLQSMPLLHWVSNESIYIMFETEQS